MKSDDALFVDSVLLQQAEQVCRKRLLRDPENRAALHSLGQVLRKQGNLDEAASTYERLVRLDPDDPQARYLHAMFSGREWPTRPDGTIPAPFVLLKSVIPAELHQTLVPLMESVQDTLVAATVGTGGGQYKPDARESLDLPNPLQWDVTKWFRRFVSSLLPTLQPRLNIPPFESTPPEVKVRAYRDGHFFRTHMDAPKQSEDLSHRKISYVYFFHRVPRPYTGGDLVLFDTDVENNQFTTESFTSITPEDNTLVVFPSHYYHCVVPLKCASGAFVDSRFVINGHMSERVAAPIDVAADARVASPQF